MDGSCVPETLELCKKGCKVLEVLRAFEQTVDEVTAEYLYMVVDSPDFNGNAPCSIILKFLIELPGWIA